MNGLLLALLTPVGPFALLLLMAVAFAETGFPVGFLLPAHTVMVSAGVLVATGTLHLPVWLALTGVALAATAGGQLAYLVGRRVSRQLRERPECRLVSSQRLAAARSFFDRHGSTAVLLSRFVPFLRTLAPVLAGVAGMERRRFLLHNAIGAAAWAAVMFGGGYWLGDIPGVSSHLQQVLLCTAGASVLPGLISLLRSRPARDWRCGATARAGERALGDPGGGPDRDLPTTAAHIGHHQRHLPAHASPARTRRPDADADAAAHLGR